MQKHVQAVQNRTIGAHRTMQPSSTAIAKRDDKKDAHDKIAAPALLWPKRMILHRTGKVPDPQGAPQPGGLAGGSRRSYERLKASISRKQCARPLSSADLEPAAFDISVSMRLK